MLKLLTSLKTTLYLIGISILVFLAGSLYIPKNLEIFSEINDFPLFQWLYNNRDYPAKTYWIYAEILLMAFLSVNMVVCTIEALLEKLSRRTLIQRLSPHILHAGVLLVLFGHLVSGTVGFKKDITMYMGETTEVDDLVVSLKQIELVYIKGENQQRWRASVSVDDKGELFHAVIEPAKPFFVSGLGLFAKSADENGRLVLGVVHDPGVKWEIAGALLFLVGAAGIFLSKYSKL